MLGIGSSKPNFELVAHGKHPAFDDYFSLNTDSPLAKALSAWVENGAKLNGNNPKNKLIRSYRFWVRGIKKGEIVLGIIRDSSDRMGRFYPLLLLAKGIVKNWEEHWNYIFKRFDTIFRALEEVAASRYENFREFETKLIQIRSPEVSVTPGPVDKTRGESRLPDKMKDWFEKEGESGVLRLSMATLLNRIEASSGKPARSRWGLFKKKPRVPSVVFQGGLPENPELSIYARPLKTEDFFDLFNIPIGSEPMGDPLFDKGGTTDGH